MTLLRASPSHTISNHSPVCLCSGNLTQLHTGLRENPDFIFRWNSTTCLVGFFFGGVSLKSSSCSVIWIKPCFVFFGLLCFEVWIVLKRGVFVLSLSSSSYVFALPVLCEMESLAAQKELLSDLSSSNRMQRSHPAKWGRLCSIPCLKHKKYDTYLWHVIDFHFPFACLWNANKELLSNK